MDGKTKAIIQQTDALRARTQARIREAYARFPDLGVFEDRYWAHLPNPPDDPRWEALEMTGISLPQYVLDWRAAQGKKDR